MTLPVRVRSIHWEATDICSFVLAQPDGAPLPRFEAGAHIDVHLPNGLVRSYSLSKPYGDGDYRITVARDPGSTGGSAFLAEHLRAGVLIEVGEARNHFPLHEQADRSVFIAGGIGITPFLPMAARLNALGRGWRLHYCVRTRDRAALRAEFDALANAGQGEVVMNYDHEPGGSVLDLDRVIGGLGRNDHVYCCGPTGMLEAFRTVCAAQGVEDERVHFEYFKSNVAAAAGGGFDIILSKTGRTVHVDEGQTILKALVAAGLDIPFSCEQGICGACETKVLSGEPDHRDLILSPDEQVSSRTMMICCSGSKTPTLTLDL